MDEQIQVYQKKEIVFTAQNVYNNPYSDIECWIQLKGPGFNKRIYGFWDGGQTFKVRIIATKPGNWTWSSDCNVDDRGLKNKTGSFSAKPWTEAEIQSNPNRHGILKVHPNGRTLVYNDGSRFFLIGDTYWSASTWRIPWAKEKPRQNYVTNPKDGMTFQELILNRKQYGFNCLAIISGFPNWIADSLGKIVYDSNGVQIRNGWNKACSEGIANMEDEHGNMPFQFPGKSPLEKSTTDLDRINPDYFKNLDKKMEYLHEQGFVGFLETIRRDHGPYLAYYYDEKETLSRYLNYLIARYGCYNIIFSAIHTDLCMGDYERSREFWKAFWNPIPAYYYKKYGHPPFGQILTALAPGRTDEGFNNAEWLMVNNCGNAKRDNSDIEIVYDVYVKRNKPVFMSEGYYVGWKLGDKYVAPPIKDRGSAYDNYCGRVHFWSCIFNGGITGGIYGTGAYAGARRTEGEIDFNGIYVDEALHYSSGKQMKNVRELIEYCGDKWMDLKVARNDITHRLGQTYNDEGLFGLSSLLKTEDKKLAIAHFQAKCDKNPHILNLLDKGGYNIQWFNPKNGKWIDVGEIKTIEGTYSIPDFPDSTDQSFNDWILVLEYVAT
jgi:hypothetical protein